MANLEKRLSHLEGVRTTANLKRMSDEELDAHIATLVEWSLEFVIAVTAKINRHGSTLPIIYDDPEYPLSRKSRV